MDNGAFNIDGWVVITPGPLVVVPVPVTPGVEYFVVPVVTPGVPVAVGALIVDGYFVPPVLQVPFGTNRVPPGNGHGSS